MTSVRTFVFTVWGTVQPERVLETITNQYSSPFYWQSIRSRSNLDIPLATTTVEPTPFRCHRVPDRTESRSNWLLSGPTVQTWHSRWGSSEPWAHTVLLPYFTAFYDNSTQMESSIIYLTCNKKATTQIESISIRIETLWRVRFHHGEPSANGLGVPTSIWRRGVKNQNKSVPRKPILTQ